MIEGSAWSNAAWRGMANPGAPRTGSSAVIDF